MKECLSGAVSTLLRKQVPGEQYLNHLEGFPGPTAGLLIPKVRMGPKNLNF